MPSGGGLHLFFNPDVIPCGPPAAPPPEIGPSIPSTIALGTTKTIGPGTPPLTIDAPPDLAAGDILLAFIHIGSPGGADPIDLPGDAGAPAVVPPAGWTLVRTDRATGGSHGDMRGFLYSHVCGASEPGTYTWTWDYTALSSVFLFGQNRFALGAIAGRIRNSRGIDTTSVGTSTGSPVVIASLTPTASGELLVGFAGDNTGSGSTVFVPSGWSQGIGPTYIQQSIGSFYRFAGGAGVGIGTTSVTIGTDDTTIGYVVAMLPG